MNRAQGRKTNFPACINEDTLMYNLVIKKIIYEGEERVQVADNLFLLSGHLQKDFG